MADEHQSMTQSVEAWEVAGLANAISLNPQAHSILRRMAFHLDMQKERIATLEAVIAKHNLCHDLHGKVGRDEFEEGCRRETIKEFGSCGWAEKIEKLEARVSELESRVSYAELGPALIGGGEF